MNRDLQALGSREFDVIVVGGGIAGISVARDAALRGLSVALIEQRDFGSGSTCQASGMLDGGIRELQRLDFGRLRTLAAERNGLFSCAPHLVGSLPIVVPTYGHGRDGKHALRAGLRLYDLLAPGRRGGPAESSSRVSLAKTLSRDVVLEMFPGLVPSGLSGAVIFDQAQLYRAARLVLALVRSAVEAGATVANALEATGLVRKGITITGVGARTQGGRGSLFIRGRTVVNTAGRWSARLLEEGLGLTFEPALTFSRRLSFVVNRRPTLQMGLALLDESRAARTRFSRTKHHFFVLPWRDHTVLGEWHRPYSGRPDHLEVTDEEVVTCVDEINERYPGLHLHPAEIVQRRVALGLLQPGRDPSTGPMDATHARFLDHGSLHGVRGVISLVGSTWGTARLDAERVVDHVFRRIGRVPPPATTYGSPVYGGDIDSLAGLVREVHRAGLPLGLSRDQAKALSRNYGTAYSEIFDLIQEDPGLAVPLPGSKVLRAEVVHAVRSEMAQTLDDLVSRRTDLSLERLREPAIEDAAHLMSDELGWNAHRTRVEIALLRRSLRAAPSQAHMYAQT